MNLRDFPSNSLARFRPLLPLALAPFLAPGLAAQVEFGTPNLVSIPVSGAYGAVAAGDIDGDLNADLALVVGGSLIVFPDPAVFDNGIMLAQQVRDVCFTEDGGNGKPGFLVTSDRGLELVSQPSSGLYNVVLLSSAASWHNARVRAARERVGSSFAPVLVGLEEAGHAVFQAPWNGTSFGAPQVLYTPVNTVLDLQLLNWDGDANDVQEVALLLSSGLQVRPRTVGATPVLARSSPVSDDSITVAHEESSPFDLLAWVSHIGGSPEQQLLLFCTEFLAGGAGPYLGPYPLTDDTYGAICAGDLQGEGKDALVLTPLHGLTVKVLPNEAVTGSWFGAGGVPPYKVTSGAMVELPPGDGDLHGVVCADFFRQHDDAGRSIETLAAVLPGSQVGVYPIVQSWVKSLVANSELCFSLVSYTSHAQAQALNQGYGGFSITLANGWGPAAASANQVELQGRVSLNNSSVNHVAFHHRFQDISGGDIDDDVISFTLFSPYFDEFTGELPDASFFAMVRPVLVDGTGKLQDSWPWAIVGMSPTCSGYHWVRGLTGASLCGPTVTYNLVDMQAQPDCFPGDVSLNLCNGMLGGASYIPSAVPQSRIPGFGNLQPLVIYPGSY